MDIKVKTQKDESIDIEVQINDVDNYRKRSLYYWSKLYGETIKKGQNYFELNGVWMSILFAEICTMVIGSFMIKG